MTPKDMNVKLDSENTQHAISAVYADLRHLLDTAEQISAADGELDTLYALKKGIISRIDELEKVYQKPAKAAEIELSDLPGVDLDIRLDKLPRIEGKFRISTQLCNNLGEVGIVTVRNLLSANPAAWLSGGVGAVGAVELMMNVKAFGCTEWVNDLFERLSGYTRLPGVSPGKRNAVRVAVEKARAEVLYKRQVKKMDIGDWVELKQPELGYRNVEIIDFEDLRIIVRTTSGYEFSVYEDEIKQ